VAGLVRADAVVVGAGITGAATAWWLTRSGRQVVLLERAEPAHPGGSSHGGVRIFRFAYPHPDYVALARRALTLWREVEAEAGETLLELTGGIDCGFPAAVDAVAGALDATGTRFERLSPAAAEERWPQFRFEHPVVFQPEGGRCFAERAVHALIKVAGHAGLELRTGEAVTSVAEVGGEAVVRTEAGEYRAPVCVLAAGAWLAGLAPGLVTLPPLRVTREQPAFFRPRPGRGGGSDPWPSFIRHTDPHAAEELGSACYGLGDPGLGVKVGEHHAGMTVDPDGPALPDHVSLARIAATVQRWIPGLDPVPVGSDRCLYTTTADEDFVIDRAGPFTVASVCSGHGFKFGPATGELVGRVATGEVVAPPRFRFR
jgi:sarcosine oxidase